MSRFETPWAFSFKLLPKMLANQNFNGWLFSQLKNSLHRVCNSCLFAHPQLALPPCPSHLVLLLYFVQSILDFPPLPLSCPLLCTSSLVLGVPILCPFSLCPSPLNLSIWCSLLLTSAFRSPSWLPFRKPSFLCLSPCVSFLLRPFFWNSSF